MNVDFADVSKVMRDSGRAHMAVATAEGDNRAEAAAEASLRSPLLDHNLISGAKNILLNISVADADGLMYEEVVRILEYIQAHASVQDDNGVIHNANIIWGTSEKPQLGNAIELVVVATGGSRAGADQAGRTAQGRRAAAARTGDAGGEIDALQQHRTVAEQARLSVAQLEIRRADARRTQGGAEGGERCRPAGAAGCAGRIAF